ncbi:DUF2249 domain-containing protein [Motiliproteus sediminis]|uniref:DUF2249 domain-containing protein n=1 Tax=Motiliproteus sediminis TaxID=1468178 RepID=UPI001AF002C4|nr:DUF2249 domain-containing protein [Motiliproteus sediminis]
MSELIEFDVSELEPPEPLIQIIAAARTLSAHQLLRVVHRRDPLPLYPLLDELGVGHERRLHPSGAVVLLIWAPSAAPSRTRIEDLLADAH